jgi:NitT/TauT family transport system ATP-binding protein
MEAAKVVAAGLCKAYCYKRAILHKLNLTVPEGAFVVITGPAGSGKTTLMRLLAGIERPDGGSIRIRPGQTGRPLTTLAFQDFALLPWLTVAENIAYGLRLRHWPAEHQRDAAEHYARRLLLTPFLDTYPHRLQPSAQQRVALARALANNPEVLLLDDPLSAQTDAAPLQKVCRELARIRSTRHHTVIYATRSAAETSAWHDQVVQLP